MNIELLKKIRLDSNRSIADCVKALNEASWDHDLAVKILAKMPVPEGKPVGAGAIFSYIHHNKLMGAIVELHCGTDFVAQREDFQEFGNDLAAHIVGMQANSVEELLKQIYYKNASMTVEEFINNFAKKFNETIKVARFQRYTLGLQ